MRRYSAELQVALLVVTAGLMLAGAYWMLGDVEVGETYPLYVDFDNPGIMAAGAAVRAGGVPIGRVESIEYRGRREDPTEGLVRMHLEIARQAEVALHEDATFTPTTQGVMSERFIAVDPGDPDLPRLPEGAVVRGVDVPRLDVFLADGYYLLETATRAMREHREDLQGTLDDLVAIHRVARELEERRGDDARAIVADGRVLAEEGPAALAAAREAYVDGARARRVRRGLDRTLEELEARGPPIAERGEALGRRLDALSATFGEEQRRQLDATRRRAERIGEAVERARGEAEAIQEHVEAGRGSIGAFREDEQLDDDLLETFRELIHNPWRFFWRE